MQMPVLSEPSAARRDDLRRFLDQNDAARYAELRGSPAIGMKPAETARYDQDIRAMSDELIKLYAIEILWLQGRGLHGVLNPAGRPAGYDRDVLPGYVSWFCALDLVGRARVSGWDGLESFTRSKDVRDCRDVVQTVSWYEARRQRVRKEQGANGLAILERALLDSHHPALRGADWHYPETDGAPRIDPFGSLPLERARVRELFELPNIDERAERIKEAYAAVPRIMPAELAALERYDQAVGDLFNLLAGGEVSTFLYDDKSGEAPRIDVRYWRAVANRSLNHEGVVTVPADRLGDWSGGALTGCVLLERTALEATLAPVVRSVESTASVDSRQSAKPARGADAVKDALRPFLDEQIPLAVERMRKPHARDELVPAAEAFILKSLGHKEGVRERVYELLSELDYSILKRGKGSQGRMTQDEVDHWNSLALMRSQLKPSR